MFKSLLRTIPTMSGNFKINCSLTDNKRIDKENFESYIRVADISPLQNILLNRNIKISLINGSYEYDVCKYFKYYSNKFYSDNYSFDKSDYQPLDLFLDNRLESRNKDYEFGCKRLPFSQTGYQMNFYAPIWCDNINDLPDYFTINLKVGNIEKNIKIYIGKYHIKNYLKVYLEKYINKIDNNVITLNQGSKSAVYYGIDVNKGGINAFNDFIISKIFTNQLTQNEFDNLITSGFKRNNIIVRQILPLSFSFNLLDFFSKNELSYFYYSPVCIKGSYNTLNTNFGLTDFDIDYYNFNLSKRIYNFKTLNFDTIISSKNLMDQNFPGLKEKRNIEYKYTNKLSPLYNRWVLLNNDNYYINNTNLYNNILNDNDVNKYNIEYIDYNKNGEIITKNYLSLIKNAYMEFPNDLYSNLPFGIFTNDNNIIIPFGNYEFNNIDNENIDWITNYIIFMNNYLTNWFNVYPLDRDDRNNYTINGEYKKVLFNYQSTWGDVNDNEIYFNGILYNFNKILKNVKGDIKLDKFNVFVNPFLEEIDDIKKQYYIRGVIDKYDNKLNNCKINLEYTPDIENGNNFIIPENDNGATIREYVYYDSNYFATLDNKYGKYVKLENYYNNNIYYDFDSFINCITNSDIDIERGLLNSFNKYKYKGIVLLPFDTEQSLYQSLRNEDQNEDPKFVYEDCFILNKNMNSTEFSIELKNFILDNIKYSKENDNNMYDLTENQTNFNLIKDSIKYLYIKKYLISIIQIKNCINEYFRNILNDDGIDKIDEILNKIKDENLETFEYIPLTRNNNKNIKDYFICSSWNKDILYYKGNDRINDTNYTDYCILMHLYNLSELRNGLIQYGYNLDTIINVENSKTKYAKFLDIEHFKNYITSYEFKDNIIIYNKFRKTKFEKRDNDYNLVFIDVYEKCFEIYKKNDGIIYVNDYNNLEHKFTDFIKNISYLSDDKLFRYKYDKENSKKLNLYFKGDFIPLNNQLYDIFDKNQDILFGLYLYTNEFDNKQYNYITEYDENIQGEMQINESIRPLFIDFFNTQTNSTYMRNLFKSNNIANYNYNGNEYFIYINYTYPLLVNIDLHPDFKSFVNLPITSGNDGEVKVDIDNIGNFDNGYSNIYFKIDGKEISTKYEAEEWIKDIISNPDNYIDSEIIYGFLYISDNINIYHKISLNINISDKHFYQMEDIYQFREYLIKCILFNSSCEYTVEQILKLDDYKTYNIFKNIKVNIINNLSIDNEYVNNYNNLLVYKNEDDGLTYGMYLLEVECNKTYNIFRTDNKENLLFVEKINGKNISNVFKKSFKYILPCLDTKLFTFYKTNNKSLLDLTKLQIPISKISKIIDNGNTLNSYKYKGIYYTEEEDNKKTYSISNIDVKNNYENIYRYFGKITPKFITYNDNVIKNRFSLLYKSIRNFINENNIINTPLNIYNYNPICVCDKYLDSKINYTDIEEFEYKHFNDNKFYLLEQEIIIEKKDYYDYNTLLSLESKEVIFEEFKNYIIKYLKSDIIDNDKILFLFNRYKYNLLSEPVKLNLLNTGKLYKLVYKFTLK